MREMQFKCLEDLKEKARLPRETVKTIKRNNKSKIVYEKAKVLSERADGMTEDSEQAYIWYSRCLCLYKLMVSCDDFIEFSKCDEFEHCREILKNSLTEFNRLKNYLKETYNSIHPVDREDFGDIIRPTQLMDYVELPGKTALVIDYRREKLSATLLRAHDSIQVVPLNPYPFQRALSFLQLKYSVDILYRDTMSEIQKFDLVVLMGDKVESRQSIFTRNLLSTLTVGNTTHTLKRDPLLLRDEKTLKPNGQEVEQLNSSSGASYELIPLNLDMQKKLVKMVKLARIYKFSTKSIEGSASREQMMPGHTGLSKLGNTRFMNSALQVLFHTSEMQQLFTKKKFMYQVNPNSKSAGAISACFSALMDSIWSGNFKYIKPDFFLSVFAKKVNAEFADRQKHDAQESFSCLLNSLHEETNQVDVKKPFIQDYDGNNIQEDADRYFKDLKLFESSPIQNLFDLTSVMTITCMECKTSSVTFENMPLLFLEIPSESHGHCPLSQCLERYFGKNVLEDSQKWNCPNCKNKQRSERSMQVWSLPPVLVICLKRFAMKNGGLNKNNINVKFEVESLDMSPYSHENSESKRGSHYKLYAVTNHEGLLNQVHYTSAVHTRETGWLKFDDQSVSSISSKDVQSQDAYILYFRKISV